MTHGQLFTPTGDLDLTVESVLTALDRWTARNDGHHTEKRSTRRFPFRGIVRITARYSGQIVHFEAPTRDISVCGVCFLVSKLIRTDLLVNNMIPASSLLAPQSCVVVSVQRNGHDILLVSEVRRLRKVHENLYECGVQFVARESSEAVENDLAAQN